MFVENNYFEVIDSISIDNYLVRCEIRPAETYEYGTIELEKYNIKFFTKSNLIIKSRFSAKSTSNNILISLNSEGKVSIK